MGGGGEGAWGGWENHQTVLRVWPRVQESAREGCVKTLEGQAG